MKLNHFSPPNRRAKSKRRLNNMEKILMSLEEIKSQIDATNTKLDTVVGVLNKVQEEIINVSETQAATIADLRDQLETAGAVPADVQQSLDSLNQNVDKLNSLSDSLDQLNPDIPEPLSPEPEEFD
jgi:ABC-type transporter Mla subunit MlaD